MYKIVDYEYSLVYLNKYISNKYKLTVEILHLNTFKCFFIYIQNNTMYSVYFYSIKKWNVHNNKVNYFTEFVKYKCNI